MDDRLGVDGSHDMPDASAAVAGVTRRAGMLGLAAAVAAGGLDATVHADRRRKDRASDDPAAVTGPTGPVPPPPDRAGDPFAPGAEGGKKKRKGPTGPTGPTGQGGPAGPAGGAGPAGPGGPAGPAGPAGPTGPAGAGTVAGPNGAVQYNAGGVLGGTAGVVYNPGTSKLTVDGNVEVSTQINAAYLANAGSTLNALYYDPSGNLVAGISDASRKTNVETLADGAAVVGRLRPVRFDWTPEARLGDRRQIGLIAQEVRDVVPEVVGERGDGLLNVEYALLVAPLIGAVQELQRRVAELEAEVRALRSRGG